LKSSPQSNESFTDTLEAKGWRACPGAAVHDQLDWRWQLTHLIERPSRLEELFGCALPDNASRGEEAEGAAMRVTPYFAGLIEPGNPDDPILRQVLPVTEERRSRPAATLDPLAESAHMPVPGLVHRYPDRVLLLPSGFCATLCRFCMRKRLWSGPMMDPEFDLSRVADHLASHTGVREVILSGGDPLLLPGETLQEIFEVVKVHSHVRMVRIGSRAPATLPMRIDDSLVDLLGRYRPVWLVTHFNHPGEVTEQACAGLERLASAGVILNNQSVLLRGVNDSTDLLLELSARLMDAGVRPYYLHHLDRVAGAGHFSVPLAEGREIVKGMFGKIGGLGIPRYVLDLPGGRGKVPLTPSFGSERSRGRWTFEAPLGGEAEFTDFHRD
jgi:lysine 2,3-aminomutase